jgi:hypothetical protein
MAESYIDMDEVQLHLEELDWSHGLTRDQIRRKYRDLPDIVYLHLPASKRFGSPEEVLRTAALSRSRAEGEFMGAEPGLPEAESLDEGGPPAWGGDPLFNPGAAVDGGSAEDREGLEEP